MFQKKLTKAACVMSALLFAAGATAQGALQLLQFEPTPVSPNLPEFSWTGPGGNFVTGAGSHGNGDGDLAVNMQTPGGLEVDTPITVPGIVNSTIDGSGTHFFDVTMSLSSDTNAASLQDNGTGIVTPSIASVNLTDGSFSFYTTPAADSPGQPSVLLLTGTLTGNSLTVPAGSTSAGYQTATVTYTGGAILNALENTANPTPIPGSASISLVSLDGNIGIVLGTQIVPGVNFGSIAPFDANATGVFDTPNVPEPASLGVVAAAGILSLRRRRA